MQSVRIEGAKRTAGTSKNHKGYGDTTRRVTSKP
jgi:hypothetical protein